MQVTGQITMERFLWSLPPDECLAMRVPQTPTKLVEALECALSTLEIRNGEAKKGTPKPR